MVDDTFQELMGPKIYAWDTPEAKKKRELGQKRNMYAYDDEIKNIDTIFRPVLGANCQWCGKPLQGRCKDFCRPVIEDSDTFGHKHKVDHCRNAFFSYWYSVAKFKRVIYLRDNFTCRYCGTRPVFMNEYGIELPNLNLLAIDHIIPIARGGKTTLMNLCVACRKCNSKKRDKLEYVAPIKLL